MVRSFVRSFVPLLDGETTPKEVLGAVNAAHDATHNDAQTDEMIFIFGKYDVF